MQAHRLIILASMVAFWTTPASALNVFAAFDELNTNGTTGWVSQNGDSLSTMVDQRGPTADSDYAIYHYRVAVSVYFWDPGPPEQYFEMPLSEVPSVEVMIWTGNCDSNGCFSGLASQSDTQIIPLLPEDFIDTGWMNGAGTTIWELNIRFTPVVIHLGETPHIVIVFPVDRGTVAPFRNAGVCWVPGGAPPSAERAQSEIVEPFTACWEEPHKVAADLMTVPDMDNDGDTIVDIGDLALVIACLRGPGVTTPPPGLEAQFALADLDNDGDVDLKDVRGWQLAFMGDSSP